MRTKFFFLLLLSISIISFSACEDDDDDAPATTTTTGGGNGSGAGTGGGTGSGGIPPNSMKATVGGATVNFGTVTGLSAGGTVTIIGSQSGTNIYPQLTISFSDSLATGRYDYPASIQPSITYTTDMSTTYFTASGTCNLQTNDPTQKLANGRFNIVVKNVMNPTDSLVITGGQFNKFYN